jgi:hypothetical protein
VPLPIARYRASPYFRGSGFVALAIASFSAWVALDWPFAWVAVVLALTSAALVFLIAFGPAIEIYDSHLKLGDRRIPWAQVRRLDSQLALPLVVRLTLADKRRVFLVHAGDSHSSHTLLKQLRRYSREALIEGIPHRQFWGEIPDPAPERKQLPPPRPLLLPDDEAEIERLFQRLKTVGHIDVKSPSQEKSSPKGSSPKDLTDEK